MSVSGTVGFASLGRAIEFRATLIADEGPEDSEAVWVSIIIVHDIDEIVGIEDLVEGLIGF